MFEFHCIICGIEVTINPLGEPMPAFEVVCKECGMPMEDHYE